jgi:hypothetical protein
MEKIKLKRMELGWQYNDILIRKRQWDLPFSCISYEAIIDGRMQQTDTLREMREYIQELTEEQAPAPSAVIKTDALKIKADAATAMDALRVAMNALIDLADTLYDNDGEELAEYANEAQTYLAKAGEIITNIQTGI